MVSDEPACSITEDFSSGFEGPQGMNTWASRFYDEDDEYVISHYAGPMPPEKPHRYTLTIYALSQAMNVKDRFFYNDFRDELAGKILTKTELIVNARN